MSAGTAPAQTGSARPRAGSASFPIRRPDFDFSEVRLFFYDDNALGSAFWAVLQALFPDGERFFIKAVRDCRGRVDDPALQAEIDAFMGQEANHGRAHREVNEKAQQVHGIDLKKIERRTARIMALFNRIHSPMQRLAMTAGAEHFTATVARFLLRHPDYLAGFLDVDARRTGHVACAGGARASRGGLRRVPERRRDVLAARRDVGVDGRRARTLVTYEVVRLTAELRGFEDRAALRRGYASLLGRKGMLMKIGPGMRDYFRRDFHPNDDDQSLLEAEWRRELGWSS